MEFKFTIVDMVTFLEKRGYKVKSEEVMEKIDYNGIIQEVPRMCYVTRYKGFTIAEEQGYGTRRLEFCFREELQKVLLGL